MKHLWGISLFILFCVKINAQNVSKSVDTINVFKNKYSKLNDSIKIEKVTFDDLLKYPKKFNGKYVQVGGYLHLELPYCTLYKSESDFIRNVKQNSIAFLMHKEDSYAISLRFNNKFAIISGIFIEMLRDDGLTKGIYQIQSVDILK